jgi:hypothetical protein
LGIEMIGTGRDPELGIARGAGSYSLLLEHPAGESGTKKGHFAVPLDFLRVSLIPDLLFRC